MSKIIRAFAIAFFFLLGTKSECMQPPANNATIRRLMVLGSVASVLHGVNSYCLARSVGEITGLASESFQSFCHAPSDNLVERLVGYGGMEFVLVGIIVGCIKKISH